MWGSGAYLYSVGDSEKDTLKKLKIWCTSEIGEEDKQEDEGSGTNKEGGKESPGNYG